MQDVAYWRSTRGSEGRGPVTPVEGEQKPLLRGVCFVSHGSGL